MSFRYLFTDSYIVVIPYRQGFHASRRRTVGIIYDTHDAKIYENLCNTKLFVKFFGMPIDYTEQIKLIALKIRTLRKARKLTVQELAYRCDIERSNLSRIETGRSNPTVKTLCIICNALDVPLRALIE